MSISSIRQSAHKLAMADHPYVPNLRRAATSLALSLGWAAVLVAMIEALSRFGEAFAQLTGLVALLLLLQLMNVALLVRALASCLVALLALILAATSAQTPFQEPVTA